MAVQYIREKKKQRYLLLVFGVVIVVTLAVVWFGFLQDKVTFFKAQTPAPSPFASRNIIQIDFDFLEGSLLKEMDVFNEVSPYEGGIGRENPFILGGAPLVEQPVEEEEESENPSL